MDYDFRFRNASGKWESVGHRKGADREAALEALKERTPGGLCPGRYMSRPRSRQKDWDVFDLDGDGKIRTSAEDAAPASPPTSTGKHWLR
ncbi:MAG TPA: hypothetical protein VJL81_07680 [Solirubrobacterales bacterium]|nr:hypothetical protein [Solirubrobacterales bacterium]